MDLECCVRSRIRDRTDRKGCRRCSGKAAHEGALYLRMKSGRFARRNARASSRYRRPGSPYRSAPAGSDGPAPASSSSNRASLPPTSAHSWRKATPGNKAIPPSAARPCSSCRKRIRHARSSSDNIINTATTECIAKYFAFMSVSWLAGARPGCQLQAGPRPRAISAHSHSGLWIRAPVQTAADKLFSDNLSG